MKRIIVGSFYPSTSSGRTEVHTAVTPANAKAMAAKAVDLLEHPPVQWMKSAMALMAREHSWDCRVTDLIDLLNRVLGNS